MSAADPEWLVVGQDLHKAFHAGHRQVKAVDGISLSVPRGCLAALVGPDGAGKTTLMRMLCGLLRPDAGRLTVLGLDTASGAEALQARIGYMPQRFGLYEDLSVQENLDLYARMHGVGRADRERRYAQLLAMTDLGHFTKRLAGQLSGGMKQKLGLACTLVRFPELLLLDEPTVGVDPLSRRELWHIVMQLVRQDQLTVIVSTAYLEEAERCDQVTVLAHGRVLHQGPPQLLRNTAAGRVFLLQPPAGRPARMLQVELLDHPAVADALPEAGKVRVVCATADAEAAFAAAAGPPEPVAASFEDGFMLLLRQQAQADAALSTGSGPALQWRQAGGGQPGEIVIEVRDLVRRFGSFLAVDHVSFEVRRGEIFGLLGPNGAGKTTTFRMLCGLLATSSGSLRVLGQDLRFAGAAARQRIGYVAQKFALYGELTVQENLEFFSGAYGLHGARRRQRLAWAVEQFELAGVLHAASGGLPSGYRQRLAMAAALMHEPEVLFLDEPTSGADPLARREFWRRITRLAAQGVTIVVTTHFMEEAEYCDRALIQDAGRLLAQGTPAELRRHGERGGGLSPSMEAAFINIVTSARGNEH